MTSAAPSKNSSAANSSPSRTRFPIPGDLLINLKKDYLRRELWVPLEKKDGIIHIIVDDPNNILKRDMIENLLKTKAVRYDVSLPGGYHQISSTTSISHPKTNPPSPISSANSTPTRSSRRMTRTRRSSPNRTA